MSPRSLWRRCLTRPAFTIIELLMAVVVIGLLASVALIKIQESKTKTGIAGMKNDLHTFVTAAEIALDNTGSYPTNPSTMSAFSFSPKVRPVAYQTGNGGWSLVLAYDGIVPMCSLRTAVGVAGSGKISCSTGNPLPFVMSENSPAFNTPVTFDASDALGTIPGALDAGATMAWDFGDGTHLVGLATDLASVTYTPKSQGTLTVRAALLLGDGRTFAGSHPLAVGNAGTPVVETAYHVAPVPVMVVTPDEPVPFSPTIVDGSQSTADGGIASVAWTFGASGPAASTQLVDTVEFQGEGTHTISLTITDASGLSMTATQRVPRHTPSIPRAALVVTPSSGAEVGATLTLNASATTAGTPASSITTYTFSVSGARTALIQATSAATATYTPDTAGTFIFRVVAQNTRSEKDSTTAVVTVTPVHVVFASITAGPFHTCGLTSAGAAYCWGWNSGDGWNNGGMIGDSTEVDRSSPTLVRGGHVFASLALGGVHTCGLTPAGVAYCWGDNTNAELGNGTTDNSLVPTLVSGGQVFASLTAGVYHTCGLTNAGTAYCWGNNGEIWGGGGEMGDGTIGTDHREPTLVGGGRLFTSLAAGGWHTCGISAGAAYCWGENGYGGLGDGTATDRLDPTPVLGGPAFASIAAGGWETCGLTNAGVAYCWGENYAGGIGDGTVTVSHYIADHTAPTLVSGGLTFASITIGSGEHTCGLTGAGVAYCWGYNGSEGWGGTGAIGDGTMTDRSVPTLVSGGLTFSSLIAGADHNCGLTNAGIAYCWGANLSGELGLGVVDPYRLVPTPVVMP